MNKETFLCITVVLLVTTILIPSASAQYAGERSFSDLVYFPGKQIKVTIEVFGSTGNVTVVETPPVGWTIDRMTHNGKHENGVITWQQSSFIDYQALQYYMTPPVDATGDYEFTGSVNGVEISGAKTISTFTNPIYLRSVSSPYCFPNDRMQVEIQALHEPGPLTVVEIPPVGLSVTGINLSGVFDNGTISWNLPAFTGYVSLKYTLILPAAIEDEYSFTGYIEGQEISGQDNISTYIVPPPGDHDGKTALTVATVSMNVKLDKEANLKIFEQYISQASEQGAHLIAFPEIALQNNPGWRSASYIPSKEEYAYIRDTAETVPGPSTDFLADIARMYGIFIVFGMTEVGSDGQLYNTSVVVGPDGFVGKHRKTYLWSQQHGGNENLVWVPEPGIGVLETPLGKIGLLICIEMGTDYCLALTHVGNADFLVSVTMWFDQSYIIDNAKKTNRWFIVSDQKGYSGHPVSLGVCLGHGCIVHPSGKIIADTNGAEGMVVVRTDLWVDSDKIPVPEATYVVDWQVYR